MNKHLVSSLNLKKLMKAIVLFLFIFSFPLIASSSNGGLVYVGRIVKPDGTALTDSTVQFLIQVYGNSTLHGDGSAGADHCLLYQETQTLDMTNSAGDFKLIIGEGSSPVFGAGVTSLLTIFRNPQNNSPTVSEDIGAISCSSGQTPCHSSSWDNDREINVTVTTSSTVLNLAAMPIRSVPFALQAVQLGGYSSDYMFRVQGSRPGSTNNFSVNQFDFLKNIGINAVVPGTPSTYQVTNLLANDPTVAQQVATKNYVDNAISGVSGSLPTLSSAKIWVGNSANAAAAVSMNGDGTIDNTGKLTVSGLQGKAVSATAPTSGQVLQFNGTNWSPTTNNYQTTTLNDAQIWVGNAGNLAAPVAMSGDATISNTGALTLATVGTAGTYTQVTVNAKGLVTSGTSPTTLAGYGITDAVKNAGGAPSVQEGLSAAIPAAGTAGRIYVATDTKLIYRDNGVSWDSMGASGTVSSVGASAPLQSSGGTTPSISFVNQNANLVLAGPTSGGAVAPTFRSLVAADI